MNIVYISLGSNISPRKKHIYMAIQLLRKKAGAIDSISDFYSSKPVGFTAENDFINCCVKLSTPLSPFELLKTTQEIERSIGRKQKSVAKNYSSRKIDVDILYFNKITLYTKTLQIPHSKMLNRKFVLGPLNDIAATFSHPLHTTTIHQLALNCKDTNKITRINTSKNQT